MKFTMIEDPKEAIYSLELTASEACVLRTIAGQTTGGGPGRKFIDKLYDALADVKPADNSIIKFVGGFGDQ